LATETIIGSHLAQSMLRNAIEKPEGKLGDFKEKSHGRDHYTGRGGGAVEDAFKDRLQTSRERSYSRQTGWTQLEIQP
jgi:hypothetical protein